MPNYHVTKSGAYAEEKGEVFSARHYGGLHQARIEANKRVAILRREGFTVKRTFSGEFSAYHVGYWMDE